MPTRSTAPAVPRSRYAAAGGIRFHYLDWPSDGPVLLCLHGAGGSAKQWVKLAAALHPAMRVIALDQRGYGESDAPPSGYEFRTMANDVAMFVDKIGLERFNLLGHSMGSRVSIVYAGQASDRLIKLVLSDPPHYPVEDKVMREMAELRSRPDRFASRTEALDYFRRTAPRGAMPDAADLERQVTTKLIARPDGSFAWGWDNTGILSAMAFMLGDIPKSLPRITCPTLVLHAVRSHLLTAEDAERTVAAIPNGALVRIDSGHGIWHENPDAGIAAVKPFLIDNGGRQSKSARSKS